MRVPIFYAPVPDDPGELRGCAGFAAVCPVEDQGGGHSPQLHDPSPEADM
jgi:hypothetical protein